MPRFKFGKTRLRKVTLDQMSMELLCSLPCQPHSADASDLLYDLGLNPTTLQQVISQLWKDHKIRVQFTGGGELYLPLTVRETATQIASDYWEKTYGEKNTETQKREDEKTEESQKPAKFIDAETVDFKTLW